MVRTLSETVIIPVAGVILTFVLCYELITMIIERNNMADFETFTFFKWIFKTVCAIFILTNTFTIVMAVFALAQNVVNNSAAVITDSVAVTISMADFEASLRAMGWGELLAIYMESIVISFGMRIMSVIIFVIIYGRMIQIYMTVSVAPIPFATMVNREWGNIGTNYLKSLFALAFQGFLIMVCVAIYAILLATITTSENVHAMMWQTIYITVVLCFTLFQTGNLARAIFGGH